MSESLHNSAQQVQNVIQQTGLDLQVVELLNSNRSAREAAHVIGCQASQIAKSVVFKGVRTGAPILVIAIGTNRVNLDILAGHAGEEIVMPDARYVREQTGFAIGGVPPVGHRNQLMTFIDYNLLDADVIWVVAGTRHAVMALTPDDLVKITGGQAISLVS